MICLKDILCTACEMDGDNMSVINYTDPAWLSLTNEWKLVDKQQQINER